MKHSVIAMKLQPATIKIDAHPEPVEVDIALPDGCIGILFAFESKKAAIDYWGKDTELHRVKFGEKS